MHRNTTKRLLLVIIQLGFFCLFLSGKTIKVPQDFSTIKQAINSAIDGDIIKVDDGFYLEKNIIIDKKIHLRSKNLFGAVIDGGKDYSSSIFLVRSEAEIEGFVLKNSEQGILQRNSPDVTWTAHDLAILDMRGGAIFINDKESNVGSASVFNILVDNVRCAFSTNDARRLTVHNCLVTNCDQVLSGSNHIDFYADKITALNCRKIYETGGGAKNLKPPATNELKLGPNIVTLDTLIEGNIRPKFESTITNIFTDNESTRTNEQSNHKIESLTLNILGDVYFRLKDHDKAAELYQTASIIGEKTGSLETIWEANYGLAKINESHNKAHDALKYYKKSIQAIENIRNKLPLMEYKSAYMQSRINVYESLIHLLYKLYTKYPTEKYHEEAFYFVESSKARALLDRFHESDIELEASLDQEIKTEMNTVLNEIAEAQISLKQAHISPDKRASLINKLEEKEDDFTSLMIRIRSQNPNFVSLFYPHSCSYSEVKDKLLDKETALLEYFITKDISIAFLATNQKLFMIQLKDRRLLKDMVEKYQYFLTLKGSKKFKGIKGGKKLFEALIGSFEDTLRANIKKLIIVPDDNLFFLPFETLVRVDNGNKQEQKKPRFLIEDFDISYAPSSTALMNLAERKIHKIRKIDLLAVASDHSEFDLFPLNFAVREVKAISKFINNRILLIENAATEKNLKGTNLSDFKIIHFATHAIFDDEKWYRSALILNPEDNSNEDDLLQPKDLFNLRFNSDLVVLSACQTRKGRLESGEGILGLTRIFLYSGSKSVLSSLWEIDDKISLRFMKYFYQYLVKGKHKDAALRLSKLEMLNSRNNHPRFWAAFVLTGSSSPVLLNDKP